MEEEFAKRIIDALKLDVPYFERSLIKAGKPAAVLILFARHGDAKNLDWSILLTRRTESVDTHKGQVAFPGGVVDEGENVIAAALRETEEEVGIDPASVQVLGELPGLSTPTGFWITPILGVLDQRVEKVRLKVNPKEIAETFWAPLSLLEDPGIYRREIRVYRNIEYPVHAYRVSDNVVWGATGAMIKNLLDRLHMLG